MFTLKELDNIINITLGNILGLIVDECKTHLCFEFISHVILCILYPYHVKLIKFPLNLVL